MRRSSILREIASHVLGEELGRRVWKRIDIIGDIAVIRKPYDVDIDSMRIIAEKLLERLRYIRSVWLDLGGVEDVKRTRNLVWLAGEKRSETLYREYGCIFKLDITRVYISPRLSYEHMRIARMVREGEFIINMFAGVGGFSIVIARYSRPRKIISIDINEDAYRYMLENVRLNKVEGIVEPVLGDALQVIRSYRDSSDRVLIPLPALALESLEPAVESLRGEGFIHSYDFIDAENRREALERSAEIYSREIERLDLVSEFKIIGSRIVRSVGPKRYQVVHDIWVRKIS